MKKKSRKEREASRKEGRKTTSNNNFIDICRLSRPFGCKQKKIGVSVLLFMLCRSEKKEVKKKKKKKDTKVLCSKNKKK